MSESATDSMLDADRADTSTWTRRQPGQLSGTRVGAFQVIFRQSVLDEIHLHGQGSPEVEVCGVLVGRGHRDNFGPYLLVEHCIGGAAAASRSTNVTFTAETWQHIQSAMDRDHPDASMLGWYHTHPGFGIFLSDMDLFIHRNFFNLPWQVALVFDPVSGEEGNFVWRGGNANREDFLVEVDATPIANAVPLIDKADALTPPSAPPPPSPASPSMPAIAADFPQRVAEHIEYLENRVSRLERRTRFQMIALVFLGAFVGMWLMQPPAVLIKPATRPAATQASPAAATQPSSRIGRNP